jgi:hypothetical protein
VPKYEAGDYFNVEFPDDVTRASANRCGFAFRVARPLGQVECG